MLADSVALGDGLFVLSPEDMVLHCVAHLFADGDLAGGLRNLWDFHCLLEDFGSDAIFLSMLEQRAVHHQLASHLLRALRLSDHLYGMAATLTLGDRLYVRRLLPSHEWGREPCKLTRFEFLVRHAWLDMNSTSLNTA